MSLVENLQEASRENLQLAYLIRDPDIKEKFKLAYGTLFLLEEHLQSALGGEYFLPKPQRLSKLDQNIEDNCNEWLEIKGQPMGNLIQAFILAYNELTSKINERLSTL